MPKKPSGLGVMALIAGLTAGAAAVFFSKKENRERTVKEAKKLVTEAKKASKKIQTNPKVKKLAAQGRTLAKKVTTSARKVAKKRRK